MAFKTISSYIFVLVISSAFAEVVNTGQCEGIDQDKCTIGEVRINPCRSKNICQFKRNNNASISFDFTPKFSATKLTTAVYWTTFPFTDLDNDACKFTNCPSEANKQQEFNYSLHIGRKFPPGSYVISWKVWNEENESEMCCFKTTIGIKK